jgi:hypothetical protein
MTQKLLHGELARTTGESLSRLRTVGFNLVARQPDDLEPEEIKLVLDCPFCRQSVPYPGVTRDGSETMAECDRCDIYFPFHTNEVYTVAQVQGPDGLTDELEHQDPSRLTGASST